MKSSRESTWETGKLELPVTPSNVLSAHQYYGLVLAFVTSTSNNARTQCGLGQAAELGDGEHQFQLLQQCQHWVHGRGGTGCGCVPVIPTLHYGSRFHRESTATEWQSFGALRRGHITIIHAGAGLPDDQAQLRCQRRSSYSSGPPQHSTESRFPAATLPVERWVEKQNIRRQ